MFRKIITTAVLVSVFTIASGSQTFAAGVRSDGENRPVTPKSQAKKEKLRDAFAKQESRPDFTEKDNLATYQKQKSQPRRFSTGTKILIGVGIAAAVIGVVVFAASRDKIEPFRNGVL